MKLPILVSILVGANASLACSSPTPGPVATPPSDVVPVLEHPREAAGLRKDGEARTADLRKDGEAWTADLRKDGEAWTAGPRSGEATLFLMADIRGILRPCGCTVELQKGGFDRLIPYLAEERKHHPGGALLHAGPLFYEDAKPDAKKKEQRERQAAYTADLVAQTGIVIAGATATDQVGSGGKLGALAERAKIQITAANLSRAGDATPSESVIKEIGGLRIGIFALASPEDLVDSGDNATKVSDPEVAATTALTSLRKRSDVVVLLSGLGLRETKRLVRKVAGIDFAVAGGMGEHPAYSEEAELVGSTRVMQFHREGRYIGRLSLRVVNGDLQFVDASEVSPGELAQLDERVKRLEGALADLTRTRHPTDPEIASMNHHLASVKDSRDRLAGKKVIIPEGRSSFSFTITPLDWDLPQDPKIAELMKAFDDELAKINIANAGTLPAALPGQATFVGSEACFECHEETRAFWKTNEHAHAWTTLVEAGKTFDIDCVSCHVTGYGMAGGALVGQTKGREAVQCEACHGPGSKHVEDSLATSILAKPTEASCVGCHNQHHSPRFKFGSFREHLLVPGHGRPLN